MWLIEYLVHEGAFSIFIDLQIRTYSNFQAEWVLIRWGSNFKISAFRFLIHQVLIRGCLLYSFPSRFLSFFVSLSFSILFVNSLSLFFLYLFLLVMFDFLLLSILFHFPLKFYNCFFFLGITFGRWIMDQMVRSSGKKCKPRFFDSCMEIEKMMLTLNFEYMRTY